MFYGEADTRAEMETNMDMDMDMEMDSTYFRGITYNLGR